MSFSGANFIGSSCLGVKIFEIRDFFDWLLPSMTLIEMKSYLGKYQKSILLSFEETMANFPSLEKIAAV